MTGKYDLKKMAEILEKMSMVEQFLNSHFLFDTIWRNELSLREFLNNSLYSLQDKISLLESTFTGIDCPAFREYIVLLLTNNDILKYPVLTEKILNILNKKYLIVRLSSAQSLTQEQIKKIKESLSRKSTKKIFMHQEITPRLLGGFVLNFANHIVDFSLRYRLQQLKVNLG
jgi:F-type H+-transporting ATPase subunit delta